MDETTESNRVIEEAVDTGADEKALESLAERLAEEHTNTSPEESRGAESAAEKLRAWQPKHERTKDGRLQQPDFRELGRLLLRAMQEIVGEKVDPMLETARTVPERCQVYSAVASAAAIMYGTADELLRRNRFPTKSRESILRTGHKGGAMIAASDLGDKDIKAIPPLRLGSVTMRGGRRRRQR